MANEITITAGLVLTENPPLANPISTGVSNVNYSKGGLGISSGAVLVSHTVPTALPLGSVATLGWCTLFNSDQNNSVRISNSNSGDYLLRLPPQGYNILTFEPAAVPYLLAITADVYVQFLLLNF